MTALDILYIVLAVSTLFIAVPLSMILWRVYHMLDRVERILAFIDRIVGYGKDLEAIPMKIIEKFMK